MFSICILVPAGQSAAYGGRQSTDAEGAEQQRGGGGGGEAGAVAQRPAARAANRQVQSDCFEKAGTVVIGVTVLQAARDWKDCTVAGCFPRLSRACKRGPS
jgi:hypothetical protein